MSKSMHIAATLGLWALAGAACAATSPSKPGQSPGSSSIYSCVDAQGHRLSSDRPIPECLGQDQRMLNRDGTVKAVVPPAQSTEEKERQDAGKRQAEQARLAREAEARRDRALLSRYPDQTTHDESRRRALEQANRQIDIAQRRLQELDVETQALAHERESITSKTVPAALRARIAANEGAVEAQKTILRDQQAEHERINQQFDAELARLRALWAGAAPGRMGPMPGPPARPASRP